MKKSIRKKRWIVLRRLLLLWLVYMAVCLILPPLFHPAAGDPESGRVLQSGAQERVRSIDDNLEALLWRLRLIEEAQEELILCTFDFRDDNSGRDMMAALFHAADRGVKVRIMVDGINGGLYLNRSKNFQELAAHENVQAKLYNPVSLRTPWRINYRMHDKYLIADDFAYILGGRNTDDLFLGNYVDSYNEDRDLLVYETEPGEGRSFLQLRDYFEQIWNLSAARPYEKTASREGILREHYAAVREKYPEAYAGTEWEELTLKTEGIELCVNPIEPKNKQPLLWERLVREMKAEEDIFIQTPYIICSRKMYQDLSEVCAGGAEVELLTNAVEGGANPFGCTDYLNQRGNVRKTGIHTYEYLGGQALHTKAVLAGDRISFVGSYNLDMRSVYLDTELMLRIDCRELNEKIRSQAKELKAKSRHVYPDGTVADGADYRLVEPGPVKKVLYGVLRVLVIPIRHLL